MRARSRLVLAFVALIGALGFFFTRAEERAALERTPPGEPVVGPPAPQGAASQRPPAPEEAEREEVLPARAAISPLAVASSDAGADGGERTAQLTHELRAWLAENARVAERQVDRYCDETRRLVARHHPVSPTRTRDAAVYLAIRVDWEGGRVGLLHLPAPLVQRMANPPLNWRTFAPADYASLDFSWFKDLAQFDHWSLSGDGPARDSNALNYLDAPIPNFVLLQNWVKLRLIKGKNEGDLAQASVEVRHLADLCASSGTLIGEMIRIAMLNIERGVWELSGEVPPSPPPTAEDAVRMRHSAFAGMYFLYPGVPRAVREKALACNPARCSALMEAIGATAALRDVVSVDEDLQWLRAQSPCDPLQAERLSLGPGLPVQALAENWPSETGLESSLRQFFDGGL